MILVTGSSGFIGRALVAGFGDEAIGLRRSSGGGSREYRCDLTSAEDIRRVASELSNFPFTHLIHAAAVTPWSDSPDFGHDKSMAESILLLCKILKIPYIFFISGWNVYDTAFSAPFSEETPCRPADEYGMSKRNIEQFLLSNSGSTQVLNLRTTSVYGPGQLSAGLIPNLVDSALHNQTLRIGQKDIKRDYLYIDDLVKAVYTLVGKGPYDVNFLNIGSGKSVSIGEVAETIQLLCQRLQGSKVDIEMNIEASKPALLDNELDITIAKSLGILQNTTPLDKGLEEYVKWRKDEDIL